MNHFLLANIVIFAKFTKFEVYPVPAGNYIQLSVDFVHYAVYTSEGHKVLEGNEYKSDQPVETSFFQPRVYFILTLDNN
ncbi:MAG: hypothetical protein IPL20_05240 [Saprospiraceae bacterium]|nr:hypothetical protein [Saprospiraceae bacterium]